MGEYKTNSRMGNGCGTCSVNSRTNRGGNRSHNYGTTRTGNNTRTYGDCGCKNTNTTRSTGYGNRTNDYGKNTTGYGNRSNDYGKNTGREGGCCELMEKLRKLEFAIIDVAHYLNAYPDSDCALAYYHKLIEERKCLLETINEECGPTTLFDNVSETCWKWVEGPWPWHVDAH